MSYKLGILLTHPVQYYSPWFSYLSERVDLEVFYAHKQDPSGQAKAGFGINFEWDVPLLEGYRYTWLNNISSNPGPGSFFGCDTPEIIDYINKNNYDAFLVFGWSYKSAFQAIYACWRSKTPVFHRGDSNLLTPRSKFKRTLKYLPYSFILPKIDAHLYVGKLNKEYLKHYGVNEEKLFFTPHFVDNNYFYKKSEESEISGKRLKIRNNLMIKSNAIVFIFVGKFTNVKRPLDIVEAVNSILDNDIKRNLHVIFVGDGPLKSKLIDETKKHRDNFHFTGFVNQSIIPEYYSASDCLILSSESETWGLVVNEAMACGIPAILSSSVGSAPDMIDYEETGIIYEMGNINSLISGIKKMCIIVERNKKTLKNNISNKSREYSMDKATYGLMNAINKVVVK